MKRIGKQEIEKIKDFLKEKKEIQFVYLFGSFISLKNYRDIDIGVYVEENEEKNLDILNYELDLSVQLEKLIKFPCDVKVINNLPISLQYSITKGKLLFVKDEVLYENFVCSVWKKYMDFKWISDIYLKEMKNARI